MLGLESVDSKCFLDVGSFGPWLVRGFGLSGLSRFWGLGGLEGFGLIRSFDVSIGEILDVEDLIGFGSFP